jgi:hypothetical protein
LNGIEVIKASLAGTQFMLKWFIDDLSDADLLVRPVPNANHAAWQIGNVIGGDIHLLKDQEIPGAVFPELPDGFMDQHGPKGAKEESPEGFLTKAEYLDLLDKVRGATIASLDQLTDTDLDRPTIGKMADFAPTLGRLYLAVSDHTMMHAGQFSVIRRCLGKPVLF